ncbi:phosphatidylinositol 4-phosphate 5-kinase-like protein 1 isoform X2 [Hemicordylus capensis]|uniref:phosphatidylinositol 4-phosphate 5-kinase-like protein 1 isoform X2 n=1 Tax=Hemicordylus capensis TaxID=884348 RepID=UPI002302C116|nr:phosphatidylinositol 4-phosphate 5-kinase-like protein 1 isoform X2 [Hemicordylus capensis]
MELQVEPSQRQVRKQMRKRHSRISKYRLLWRIREQWKLLGFFEINQDHEFYELTCMLKKGLQASVQEAIDTPQTTNVLSEANYTAVLKQTHEVGSSHDFEMRTYAGPVFAHFRSLIGIIDTDYQNSLCCEPSYLQFISNSKSSADFFLTNDKRFFLKTQSKREASFLRSNLSKYIEYLTNYPHSLLVKFLGLHSITAPPEKKRYFIIMQSVFYPHERICDRYDLKGCQLGRWTDAAPEGSQVIVVFKDLNFEGKTINLGDQQRNWFLQQMELDTKFLKALDVMDYSVLVGLQPLHEDEQILNQKVANIIATTAVSLSPGPSQPNLYPEISEIQDDGVESSFATRASSAERLFSILSGSSRTTIHHLLTFYMTQRSSFAIPCTRFSVNENTLRQILTPETGPGSTFDFEAPGTDTSMPEISLPSMMDTFPMSQNRRLLSSSRNPLHVIDGPDYRYFVGIIDLFTVYGFRKKVEHLWKSIRFRGQSFSTVNPACYARRLYQWVEEHTT